MSNRDVSIGMDLSASKYPSHFGPNSITTKADSSSSSSGVLLVVVLPREDTTRLRVRRTAPELQYTSDVDSIKLSGGPPNQGVGPVLDLS